VSGLPARRRCAAPVPQRTTASGWGLARQPGIRDAYRVLFRGQHVGWLHRGYGGWRWQTSRRSRGLSCSSVVSEQLYPDWEAAAAALARTPYAKWIAGYDEVPRRARHVPPGEWRPALGLAGRVWTPRPYRRQGDLVDGGVR